MTVRNISYKMKIPKTTCMFHLNNLKQKQQIKTNSNSVKRFFAENISNDKIKLFVSLRTPTSRKIVLNLIENDMKTFQDLHKDINKSKSTVSVYLKKLINENIIQMKTKNNEKMYFLVEKECLKELIKNLNF